MAKRKAARSSAGKKKTAGRKTARRARKAARPRKAARTSARASRRTAKKAARPARRPAARPRSVARKAGRTPAKKAASGKTARPRTAASKKAVVPVRKAPALNRERRVVRDDDVVQTPPSSLDLDRTASAARSGRRNLRERFAEHTETSPALTAGDVDADWESAYSVGDEAPGGDNPTPDQDIVDDIGRAVGIEYQDNEELKGANKVEERDKKRWELDPASSEDWEDR